MYYTHRDYFVTVCVNLCVLACEHLLYVSICLELEIVANLEEPRLVAQLHRFMFIGKLI